MRKYIAPCIIVIIALTAGCTNDSDIVARPFINKPLPDFDMILLDSSSRLNTAAIPKGKPFLLFLFSPYCTHCQAETEMIMKRMTAFKNVQLYFISPYPNSLLKQYSYHYGMNKYKNITVGYDYNNYYSKFYNVQNIPFLALYDKQKLLKRAFIGEGDITKIEEDIANE